MEPVETDYIILHLHEGKLEVLAFPFLYRSICTICGKKVYFGICTSLSLPARAANSSSPRLNIT